MNINKNIVICLLIIVVVISAITYYFFWPISSTGPTGRKTYFSPCVHTSETGFLICYEDSALNEMTALGSVNDLSINSVSYDLLANDYIEYLLNLSSLNLPSSYRVCVNSVKLISPDENTGDASMHQYDSTTNTEFVCVSKIYTGSNHFIYHAGTLPCMQSQFPIVEAFIFPATFNGTTITDFKNNINLAEKIFSAYGETQC
jgi:hypothetical protein